MEGICVKSPAAWTSRAMLSPDKPADCILVVDDNPESLYHLGGILLDVGYEVEFAGDGLSALEWISLKRFDSILLDVRMPVMNGFEISSHIRRSSLNRETPVIFLTAYNDLGRITGNSGMAGSDYITKPFRKRELQARLRTKVNEGKAGRNFRLYLEEIEASNLYIKQSLEYAVYIQNAIMKSFGEQQESLPEHFILSIPRDIISGDFHCFYRNRGKLTTVIMDCTGHGVPGALMSILGVTLCNEIVLNENITSPDEILNCLKGKLLRSLGEGRSPELIRDGMEGAVITIDESTGLLQYAGSYNPLLMVRHGELKEIRGDRIPIGYSDVSRPFSLYELQLEKGDMVYLFTDGYADQFGGERNKKYMISRLRHYVTSISTFSVEKQKESLLNNYMAWKGIREQTDDVLVLGLRF